MLLDDNLALKVTDFGCSAIDGNSSTGGGNPRFYPDASECPNWKAKHDVFALGSTIYEIFAGKPPFHDVPSSRVDRIFQTGSLPDLNVVEMPVEMQRIVQECWSLGFRDASSIHGMIAVLQVI
jgi:serine/threonine protein kinase